MKKSKSKIGYSMTYWLQTLSQLPTSMERKPRATITFYYFAVLALMALHAAW